MVVNKPAWQNVYNSVTARSTASDMDKLPQFTAAITDPFHPAFPANLGSPQRPRHRNLPLESPLLRNFAQVSQAAVTRLAQVSRLAESYEYQCIVDPSRDEGDSILASTIKGQKVFQIQSLTYPLTVDGPEDVCTLTTVGSVALLAPV